MNKKYIVKPDNNTTNIKKESIEISVERDEQEEDEVYCCWYKCPKCSDTNIRRSSNFCPNCGVKLTWIK